MEAPTWKRVAFGTGDADFVGAIDLEAVRADPLFGPIVARLARHDDLQVLLRASQIDVVGNGTKGTPDTWVAVVHGVEGPPRPHDIGSGVGEVVTVPGAWLLGEGPAFQRVRASPPGALARISIPDRALALSTVQGRALARPKSSELFDTTEGLTQATVEVLGGEHLELIVQCDYVDHTAARRAATAARLLLVAAATRNDAWAQIARDLLKVDLDVSGAAVSLHVTVSDDLRDLLQSYVNRAS